MTTSSSVSLTVMSVSLACAVPADVKASSTKPSPLMYYILFLTFIFQHYTFSTYHRDSCYCFYWSNRLLWLRVHLCLSLGIVNSVGFSIPSTKVPSVASV